MKIASLSEIKRELKEMPNEELFKIIIRMASFKKENKELLNYLIFESSDEEGYRVAIKNEVEEEFAAVNTRSVYLAKKSIRRVLRIVSKHIKYSGSKQTEVELLIFFCQQIQKLNISIRDSKVLTNLYNRQLFNIEKALKSMDEDLQFDYQADLEKLTDVTYYQS
jgi:hypothetical protein